MIQAQRVVDRQAFDKIECSRCGQCCESIAFPTEELGRDADGRTGWWQHRGPLGFLEMRQVSSLSFGKEQDTDLFFGQLEPWQDEQGRWRYKCGHFQRDANGMGVCTIYDKRPGMCANFPYGRPISNYSDCTWNVAVLDFEVVQS